MRGAEPVKRRRVRNFDGASPLQSRNTLRRVSGRQSTDFPPRGWLDAGFQFFLFFVVYNLYGWSVGSPTGARTSPSPTPTT